MATKLEKIYEEKEEIMMRYDDVLEFIHRRFPVDNDWLTGNCYYFAMILKERFGGTICYDVIDGHFLTVIDGVKYDWSGVVPANNHPYVIWDSFECYDRNQFNRVYMDCIL